MNSRLAGIGPFVILYALQRGKARERTVPIGRQGTRHRSVSNQQRHQAHVGFYPGGGFESVPYPDLPEPHGPADHRLRKELLTVGGVMNQ